MNRPGLGSEPVRILLLLLPALCAAALPRAALADAAEAAREWRRAHEQQIVDEYVELLSIPNVADDEINIRRNAEHILALLAPRGLEARLLEAPGSPPAVYAERLSPGADTTLLIYAHYDGQPANPADWASDPWTPVLRDAPVEQGGRPLPLVAPFDPEARLFARSASDDKAPIAALLAAIDALDSEGLPLAVNLKLFLDGEEEAGSPHLGELMEAHRDLLAADLWLFCDGPVHQSRRPLLSYGVRGDYTFDLTVYGANRPLHSGHYGNWVPNPIMRLVELIGSMRDGEGNVLVAGFDDEVVPPTLTELEAVEAAPAMDEQLIRELGIGRPETDQRLELALLRPAFNLRGIRGGDVGQAARNSIDTEATASIDIRLVPGQTLPHIRDAIEQHIRSQGYHVVYAPPAAADRAAHSRIARIDWAEAGYPAYRAPMDLPIVRRVAAIVDAQADGALVELPTMGGSLPLYDVHRTLGAPILILPIANHDNNQHGANENLRLQNLWDAIEIYAAVLAEL